MVGTKGVRKRRHSCNRFCSKRNFLLPHFCDDLRDCSLALLIWLGINLVARAFSHLYCDLLTEQHIPIQDLINPNVPRDVLDYKRCANLHNQIVKIGWRGQHPGQDVANRNKTTWWEYWGDEANKIKQDLTPSLVEFLKQAEVGDRNEGLHFTYHLAGLASPGGMWWGLRDMDEEETYVLLYDATMGSHKMGLVFDHENNLAAFTPTIFDLGGSTFWYPLEVTLSMYLSMIQVGKMVAVEDSKDYGHHGGFAYVERYPPWEMRPFCEKDLEMAVHSFEDLVQTIMKKQGISSNRWKENDPLVDADTLDSIGMKPSLLRSFLLRAHRPPFTYIAPGMTYPTPSTIRDLLTEPPDPSWFEELRYSRTDLPILLFPSNERITDDIDGGGLYHFAHTTLKNVRAGLYLAEQCASFANGVRFVTPFPLGANGHARKADWSVLGQRGDGSGRYTDLYQLGYNPFINGHDVQLHHVLMLWKTMIDLGLWEVDGDGVKGGIDAFRMADTEENWWRFWIGPGLW